MSREIPESQLNARKKSVDTMNQTIHEPLIVTQEAVEAYEKKTGFFGIGQVMVEDGHWKIVTRKEFAEMKRKHGSSPSSLPLTTGETAKQNLTSGHKSLTQAAGMSGGKA